MTEIQDPKPSYHVRKENPKYVWVIETGDPPTGWGVRRTNVGHCYLPSDLAQGGESLDFAQDHEPVERLVEPFVIWVL